MKTPMKFSLVETPSMHAYEATVGNRRVQAIRAYEGEWFVCCYLNGNDKPLHQPREPDEPQYVSYDAALKQAKSWLLEHRAFNLVWSPEGRKIGTVKAESPAAAIRKAPQPYRKYQGEIYAQEVE